jgi:uncharacterized protein
MRILILAITVALTLAAGPARAEQHKSPHADVGNGRVAWFDITASKLAVSRDFYGKLFGWTFKALEGTEYAVEIVAGGRSIGTLRVAEGKLSAYDGVVYIQVADMQASCKKAVELGGTIPTGFPFNLDNRVGAVAIVVDPSGHPVGMYSRTPVPAEKPAEK